MPSLNPRTFVTERKGWVLGPQGGERHATRRKGESQSGHEKKSITSETEMVPNSGKKKWGKGGGRVAKKTGCEWKPVAKTQGEETLKIPTTKKKEGGKNDPREEGKHINLFSTKKRKKVSKAEPKEGGRGPASKQKERGVIFNRREGPPVAERQAPKGGEKCGKKKDDFQGEGRPFYLQFRS